MVDALLSGRLVPVLGAGVNLADRPAGESWRPDRYLPTGYELGEFLAQRFRYPSEEVRDLSRVAQYVTIMEGSGYLYHLLRDLFTAAYGPSAVQRFLASIPAAIRARGGKPSPPLIATTNYDDALEQAFESAGEPVDVLWYATRGDERGKFWHREPSGETRLVQTPSKYRDVDPSARSVILKLYGSVDRETPDRDSFVITEDDYVDYLAGTSLADAIPVTVAARLRRTSFLFLGYSVRDWNLRMVLNRIWGHQGLSYKSWAVQRDIGTVDRTFWDRNGVEVMDYDLHEYIDALREGLDPENREALL